MDLKLGKKEGEIRTRRRPETTKGWHDQCLVDLGDISGFWQDTRGNELGRGEVVVRELDASNLDDRYVAGLGKGKPGGMTLGNSG